MTRPPDEAPRDFPIRSADERGSDDTSEFSGIVGAPGEGEDRGWQTYTRSELDQILPRFDLGRIELAREYRRGSRSAPKLKILSEQGQFLLKRRSLERHPVARIRYSHAFQAALGRQGFPVAPLLADRLSGDTLLIMGEHAYELFRFVLGDRFDKSSRGAARAGEALAKLHAFTREFDTSQASHGSYHDAATVRIALERFPESVMRVDIDADTEALDETAAKLRTLYARSVDEVRELGFARLRRAAVHGDWHPGNVIFERGMNNLAVAAVIDFDSARSEPIVTELANGMAQFSIRGDGTASPLEWPAEFDANRMQAFLQGYLPAAATALTAEERSMLPWLMIEALIAESAVPVANQGAFADLPGAPFMALVARKCEWVRQHRKAISSL